jgi:hypothetical protein
LERRDCLAICSYNCCVCRWRLLGQKKWILRQEEFAHIETAAEINFVSHHGRYWIIELIAWVENKGSAEHIMQKFNFDLSYMTAKDDIVHVPEFGGQILFQHHAKTASFLPDGKDYFFIQPSVRAKYSYVMAISDEPTVLIFHWSFDYTRQIRLSPWR